MTRAQIESGVNVFVILEILSTKKNCEKVEAV
jgi:hypothetical protein